MAQPMRPQTIKIPPPPTAVTETDSSTSGETHSYLPSPTAPLSALDSEHIFEAHQQRTDYGTHTTFQVLKIYLELLFRFLLSVSKFIWKLTIVIFTSVDNLPLYPRLAFVVGVFGIVIYGFLLDPLIGGFTSWASELGFEIPGVAVEQRTEFETGVYSSETPASTVVLSATPLLTSSLFTATESSSTPSAPSSSYTSTSQTSLTAESQASTAPESSTSGSTRRTKPALWPSSSSSASRLPTATPIPEGGWPATASFAPATVASETYIPLSDVISMVLTASTVFTWGEPTETFAVPVATVGNEKYEEDESRVKKEEL